MKLSHRSPASRMRLAALSILLGVLLGILPHPAAAQCSPTTIFGHPGGETTAVCITGGGFLMAAHGTLVQMYGLSNPAAPTILTTDHRAGLHAPARKIDMTQGSSRAFVLMEDGDVAVLSVSYTFPVGVTTIATITQPHAVDILADGTRVWIARLEESTEVLSDHIDSSIACYDATTTPPTRVGFDTNPLNNQWGFDRLARIGNVL